MDNPLLYWGGGVLVALALAAAGAGRARLDVWTMYLAGLAGIGGALAGGQAGVIGAFAGAALAGGVVIRARGGEFLRYADAAVPGIALGYAVYRVGCFLNGCCFGIAHDDGLHPTQLYHAAAGAMLFLGLIFIRGVQPGARLAGALLAYGASRFAIEFFRGDAVPVWWILDRPQLLSIVMVAAGATLWMTQPRLQRSAG
jgi:phosphatidylglycerol:prolipoprotein diacylglycerol transferase